MVTLTVILGDP